MNLRSHILLIPDKADIERDAVANAWESRGDEVIRIGKFWQPPEIESDKVFVYGNDIFCQVLAQILKLNLISPSDNFMERLSHKWIKRNVEFITLTEAKNSSFPVFLKSAAPKVFKAAVYKSENELEAECKDLEDTTLTIRSEIVSFEAEARCFILNGNIMTSSIYEGNQRLADGLEFLEEFLYENQTPETLVIDIGYISGRGWSILEANPSWGAGLNGCSPEAVCECIRNSVGYI